MMLSNMPIRFALVVTLAAGAVWAGLLQPNSQTARTPQTINPIERFNIFKVSAIVRRKFFSVNHAIGMIRCHNLGQIARQPTLDSPPKVCLGLIWFDLL